MNIESTTDSDYKWHWYCWGSLLRCDNWRIDLDEHIRSRINQLIATDCRTFWCRPLSTWWRPAWPTCPAIIDNNWWLILLYTYLIINIYSQKWLDFHQGPPLVTNGPDWVQSVQVACPIAEKQKSKLSNQMQAIPKCHWAQQIWLVSLVLHLYAMRQATLRKSIDCTAYSPILCHRLQLHDVIHRYRSLSITHTPPHYIYTYQQRVGVGSSYNTC